MKQFFFFIILKNELKNNNVLQGDESPRVAIKSLTVVPVEDWSLDLIKPFPVCVMQNEKCVQATFRTAADSKRIEFAHDNEEKISKINPDDIFDSSTKLIYLDREQSTIELQSKVPEPGQYHVVVRFYQPNHPQFQVIYKINTDKNVYDGKLAVRNCPSSSGCRELLKHDHGNSSFSVDDKISITFTV